MSVGLLHGLRVFAPFVLLTAAAMASAEPATVPASPNPPVSAPPPLRVPAPAPAPAPAGVDALNEVYKTTPGVAAPLVSPLPDPSGPPSAALALPGRPRIGLVLGGGGAKGFAHIGVLQELERLRIPVQVLSGTSMGAVVGSMYAIGNDGAQISKIAHSIDWNSIFRDRSTRSDLTYRRKTEEHSILLPYRLSFKDGSPVIPAGVLGGQRLFATLQSLLANERTVTNFDNLPTPYRAVATNITTGDPVIMGSGDISTAVFASMAVPAALPPVERDGVLLVDGGISDNLPINVAREMGVDVIIAVNVGESPRPAAQITSALSVLNQMQLLLGYAAVRDQIAAMTDADVLVSPDINGLSVTSFDRIDLGIERGRQAAIAVEDKLRRYSVSEAEWQQFVAARAARTGRIKPIEIDYIKIANTSRKPDSKLLAQMTTKPGDTLNGDRMLDDVGRIWDLGGFSAVNYNVLGGPNDFGLQVNAEGSPFDTRYFQFGMLISSDFGSLSTFALAVGYTDREFLNSDWEFRGFAQVGSSIALNVELYRQWGKFFFEPYAYWNRYDTQIVQSGSTPVSGNLSVIAGGAGARAGMVFGNWGEMFAGVRAGGINPLEGSIPTGLPNGWNTDISWGVGFNVDTVDSLTFPKTGLYGSTLFSDHTTGLGGKFARNEFLTNWVLPMTWGKTTLILGGRFGTTWDSDPGFIGVYQLGGFLQLSGNNTNSLIGQQELLGRAILYHQISQTSPIGNVPIYIGGSIETGNTYTSLSQIDFGSLRYGLSAFIAADTPIGPAFLAYGHGTNNANAVYLIIGRVF